MGNRLLLLAIVLSLFCMVDVRPSYAEAWQQKVDPVLLDAEQLIPGGILVLMQQQADLSGAAELETKEEKGRYVFNALKEAATLDQLPLRTTLDVAGVGYQTFWIANMVWVHDSSAAVLQQLAERDDVAKIYTNPSFTSSLLDPEPSVVARSAPSEIEWNLLQIGVPAVWELGHTGEGVVVGAQDTGYDWTHPALQQQYRGWDGENADHNFNWHDAAHGRHWLNGNTGIYANKCGFDSTEPCDDQSHGTHTLGTIVGNDLDPAAEGWPQGAENAVGVAPGAEWIGCRSMENGWGTPASYSECFEWFVAPTDLEGKNADPDLAPHVINNSWSCPESEGCTDADIMQLVVDNVRAAGIVVVAAAGNSGPDCETVHDPIAIYNSSFTVGATNNQDQIVSFSSRGNVSIDGSDRFKPDVTAPGRSIRSTTPIISDSSVGYGFSSGTSMAGPHVAGLVALLISAEPTLAGNVDLIEQIIRETAEPIAAEQACGGIAAGETPNAVYGAGRIDAEAAVRSVLDATNVNFNEIYAPNNTVWLPIVMLSAATLSITTRRAMVINMR